MKRFLKIAGIFVILLLLGAIDAYSPAQPQRVIEGSELIKSLSPLSWNHPKDSFPLHQDFSMVGKSPSELIVASPEEDIFDFNRDEFISSQKASTFRDAQIGYFGHMGNDSRLNRHSFEAPHLRSWGALPYPPLREIPHVVSNPASTKWLNDPSYQLELDRITGHELTKNESIEVFQNGKAVDPILKVIGNAKRFVYVNVLSLVCDASTEPVIHLLEERAKSGIDVRLILNRGYSMLDPACLKRMSEHEIQVVKAPTHSSYFVNDQDEVVLGAESVARMFYQSDGYNFLDRDLMILVKGPVSTDVLKNFISIWDKQRADDQRDSKLSMSIYLEKRTDELKAHLRARRFEDDQELLAGSSKGLCRFAEQMPKGEERSMEALLVSLAGRAKEKIFMSGVKFDSDSPVFKTALSRAKEGVDFQFLGNGWEGGDGELTLYLDELISEHPLIAPFLRTLRSWDVDRVARRRAQASAPLSGLSHVQLWSFFSFLHYKVGLFDQEGVWIGSANPDWDSVTSYDETGIFCLDHSLAQVLSDTTDIDLANSIPILPVHSDPR